jgi:hypothetical protein
MISNPHQFFLPRKNSQPRISLSAGRRKSRERLGLRARYGSVGTFGEAEQAMNDAEGIMSVIRAWFEAHR